MTLEQRLRSIEWGSLRHAYGVARDLPDLVRRRASADPAQAREASRQLWDTIWHQGTVYEATAPIVPILALLAATPRTIDRADLILLLAAIARGHSYAAVHGTGSPEDIELERRWVDDARTAVRAAAPEPLSRFKIESRDERVALAVLAAVLPETGMRALHDLRVGFAGARTYEERQMFAASIVLCGETEHNFLRELSAIPRDDLPDDAFVQLTGLLESKAGPADELVDELASRALAAIRRDHRTPVS